MGFGLPIVLCRAAGFDCIISGDYGGIYRKFTGGEAKLCGGAKTPSNRTDHRPTIIVITIRGHGRKVAPMTGNSFHKVG